jgi:hypothetical protein
MVGIVGDIERERLSELERDLEILRKAEKLESSEKLRKLELGFSLARAGFRVFERAPLLPAYSSLRRFSAGPSTPSKLRLSRASK